ncbi:MAG TPA: hypothetical protein PKJ20_07070 [Bacillota bacterium]|jgi:hypothetical protein|nr:hypothetical protein [Bacillota bacterium]
MWRCRIQPLEQGELVHQLKHGIPAHIKSTNVTDIIASNPYVSSKPWVSAAIDDSAVYDGYIVH